jgi:hypothetical protein
MNLKDVPVKELIYELQKRNAIPDKCPTCRKYTMSYRFYAGPGDHWHCDGCNRWIEHCTCGR